MINDFKTFAASGGANVSTQVEYAADTLVLSNGFTSGIAESKKLNKVWRQASIISKVITEYIQTVTGEDCLDDGTTNTLLSNLANSIAVNYHATATGTVDVILADFNPNITILVDGLSVNIKTLGTNTGPCTFSPNGLSGVDIVKQDGLALVVGDMPSVANLVYSSTTSKWVLLNPLTTVNSVGSLINSAVAKTVVVDADMLGLMDSAASNVVKKLSWLNLKATLKTYFDTVYPLSTVAATKAGVQEVSYSHAAAGGTVNAITATYTPAVTTLVDGTTLFVVALGANTNSTPTFSPNGLTARTIVKGTGQTLLNGDIEGAGHILELKYKASGTVWVLQNPSNAINLGNSQTWTSVTGSRAKNTTYTNSTKRPIAVVITAQSAINVNILVAGLTVTTTNVAGDNTPYSFIVPDGATYIWNSASGTINNWVELR